MRPVLEDYEQSPLLRRDLEALRQSEPTVTLAQGAGSKRKLCYCVFTRNGKRQVEVQVTPDTVTTLAFITEEPTV